MNKKEIGLYIHIPFCAHKCDYCDFVSFSNKEEIIEQYIQKIIDEIEMEKLKQYKIKTIYIGGGTPSFIPSKYIVKILQSIDMENAEEITIEINPGTVNREKLEDYYNIGINRLSIGLQSTDNKILKQISRIHTYEEFLDTYKLAKEVGFTNINVDLMIGLPNQTLDCIKNSLEEIISIKPQHISVYSLILEEGTKLEKQVSENLVKLPSEDEERKMYWCVKQKLEECGYTHYEISNFAIKGFESKHNSDCWKQKEYIGIGLAAHSYIDDTRYSNTCNLNEYLYNLKESRIQHEVQSKEEKQREYMLLGLRKIEGINIQEFKNKFVENPIYLYRRELEKLVKNNLLEIDTNYIKLTKKGIDLANIVWEEFV